MVAYGSYKFWIDCRCDALCHTDIYTADTKQNIGLAQRNQRTSEVRPAVGCTKPVNFPTLYRAITGTRKATITDKMEWVRDIQLSGKVV